MMAERAAMEIQEFDRPQNFWVIEDLTSHGAEDGNIEQNHKEASGCR
jgi:hypothetical protein